jgi:membrane fusion protein, heavy metal efflux system
VNALLRLCLEAEFTLLKISPGETCCLIMKISSALFWKLNLVCCVGSLLVAGCSRHEHSHDAGHGHDEAEPKMAQITIWGERHEIFAEHRYVIAGNATKFVTHVTDLKTLKPRSEGPITFHLRLGSEAPLQQVEKEPTRAGIYEAMLKFPKAGEWNVSVVIPTEDGDKTVQLTPVQVYASEADADKAPEQEVPEGISFLKEQQWKILSKTEAAERRNITEHIRLAATVTPKPGSMASVVAPVSGRLLLPPNKPLPVPGQKVQAGELLVLLQPTFSEQAARLLEAEAGAIRAKAALDQAKLTFERTKRLAASEAKTQRELQEAEFALKSAEAQFEAATALQATYKKLSPQDESKSQKLDLSSVDLRAPIDGVISHVGSNLGEPVTPERILFTILNADTVWLEARLPESRLSKLPQKPTANFQMASTDEKSSEAHFVYSGMQIDPSTRTVPLAFEVSNKEQQLRIGQTVQLFVQTQKAENGIAVPESAIVEEEGRPVVFVQLSGETFEKRDVIMGVRGGGFVQVVDGLKEGERVATKGAYAIRLASVSSVIPAHGHAH